MNQIHSSFFSNSNWPYDWSIIPLNDTNFQTAVDLWFSDQASAISTYGHIKDWNVSGVTSMASAFKDRTGFNENITAWDVSNVTNMANMFNGASTFNQPISDWDVSSVKSMYSMFAGAIAFNQPIGNWDVSSVTHMGQIFKNEVHSINRLGIGMCLR